MCRDNDNQFFKVKFFFRYHYSCRTITNTSNVVFVQGAAGAFRSVWKVGSRWSSVDRLFEPHVSLTWLLRRRPERGNFRVSFPRTNAERYPTTLSLSAAFVFHFISLSLFSIPSRWILDSILSTRDKLRDGAELLNLCLLINPTRSPHDFYLSLSLFLSFLALVNFQSLKSL